ncbi:MAG: fibronectin type III domain-containing protein [Desulfobacteraceae bacterium]
MSKKLILPVIFLITVLFLTGYGIYYLNKKSITQRVADEVAKKRPYSNDSPWNLKIGPEPVYDPDSDLYIAQLHGHFGANPDMYAKPVYEVSQSTPQKSVTVSGWYSNVINNGTTLIRQREVTVTIPIPENAVPAKGRDANIILWDPETGDEWGFWQAKPQRDGTWIVRNGYHYNTNWKGVPPVGFLSRGAGLPYLAGLIRPWELEQGRIEHAIAFSVNYPSRFHVYPATKSDGKGLTPDLPSGARLQLDPSLSEKDFQAWGLSREGQVIAKALQEYGMILANGGGHPKISIEYEGTAHWGKLLDKNIVRNIPYPAFKLLSLNSPEKPAPPKDLRLECKEGKVLLTWEPSPTATRYQIKRMEVAQRRFEVLADWVTSSSYVDTLVKKNIEYEYLIFAVNHNGISEPSKAALLKQ